ncbi:MAG: ABC transporter ATP-binding protein [Planctomycetota bacterium]
MEPVGTENGIPVEVRGVTKRFGRNEVLRGIDLTVRPGCVHALLGENGAGKTTLMRLLVGFLRADGGAIRVLGVDPGREPFAVRRRIGYLADAPALYDWMTVQQVGWFCSAFHGPGYPQAFVRWAEDFHLPPATRVRALSKGMRAKTALASVLAAEPPLLLLDEPTSGLDPVVRREFLQSMVDIAAEGRSVLISSHQVAEVERVADHVTIIHEGRIVIDGPLDDLKAGHTLVSFTLRDPFAVPPPAILDLAVRWGECQGRSVRLLVPALGAGVVDGLAADPAVGDVRVVRPALEDLYVAFTQPCGRLPWDRAPRRAGAVTGAGR